MDCRAAAGVAQHVAYGCLRGEIRPVLRLFITRPALERIAGDAGLSTLSIAQRFADQIEMQCLAFLARVDVEPVGGWMLDAADTVSIA